MIKFTELALLPRSYAAALLVAFGIVIAPLAVALVHAVTQMQVVAKRGEVSVARAARVGEQSRALREALVGMERATRQASVIGAPEVVDAYTRQRSRFFESAAGVAAAQPGSEVEPRLAPLRAEEAHVYGALKAGRASEAVDAFPALQTEAERLAFEAESALAREREAIAEHPKMVLADLASMAVLAVPIALLLAALFAWALWRPVRIVVREIRRLGDGEWDEPVRVRGQTEIARIGPQLEWLRQRLLELEAARSRLAQQVSHDLKTPLAAITEGRALLADELYGPINDRQRAVLAVIERNSTRLLAQIDSLLRAARHDPLPPADSNAQSVELRALIQGVLDDHRFAMEAKRIQLETALESVALTGHEEQLRMLIDNLVSNAVKFSPTTGRVDIRLAYSDGGAVFVVSDEGPGVANGEEELIFERNARGSAARMTGTPGSGVGLSIARELTRAHGGRLRVAPRGEGPLKGAQFILELPRARVTRTAVPVMAQAADAT